MHTNELVSIILPTYNRLELLKEAIDSVLKQTYTNLELIVIDDGSSDETRSYVENHLDKRIRFISQENMGRSSARNAGFLECKGELISFIDSDDLYLPNKIEIQVKYLSENPEYEVMYTAADCFAGSNYESLMHRYNAESCGSIYQEIAAYVPLTICLPTVMFRRVVFETIGLFDITLDRFEDTDYWRRISKDFQFGALNEVTCLIRTHGGNSIDGISMNELRKQVLRYGDKVLKEDHREQGPTIYKLVANLYRHYSYAIHSMSKGTREVIILNFMAKLLDKIYENRFKIVVDLNSRKVVSREGRGSTFRFHLFLCKTLIDFSRGAYCFLLRRFKSKIMGLLRRADD
jgi:glycosyltransferase involved in cell wall biosynthesis